MAPTYVFKHGKVYTVVGGKVVAAVKEADFREGSVDKESKTAGSTDTPPDLIPPGIELVGLDGNAFAIMGAMRRALREAGNSPEVVESYLQAAQSGDYDNLLQVTMAYNGDFHTSKVAQKLAAIKRSEDWDGPQSLDDPEVEEWATTYAIECFEAGCSVRDAAEDLVNSGYFDFESYGPTDHEETNAANFAERVLSQSGVEIKRSKVARPVGELIEPVDNLDEADTDLDMPDPPDDLQEDLLDEVVECPACGETADESDSFCSKCGEPLSDTAVKDDFEIGHPKDDYSFDANDSDDATDLMMSARPLAKVTTPNGLEGKVMNRVAGLWGDEVTVRFDNGQIKKMPVTSGMKFSKVEQEISESPVEALRIRLNSSVEGDLSSLKTRKENLQTIQRQASDLIAEAKTHEERKDLDKIALEASFEEKEIDQAIEHYIDAKNESFIPTAPFKASAVEQADLGAGDGGWLAEVVSSMNEDARSTDYAKLMDEGPISFIVEADDATVANAGVTRIAATRYVRQFTSASVATTTQAQRSQYEKHFLDRVEEARRKELNSRKSATRKEASKAVEAATDAPDDALFF
jgi:hypothetical protein